MRDTVAKVNIDILLSGDYPGYGLPKPVSFPDPATLEPEGEDDLPVLPLRTLIELKLASGMTAPHRPRDLDDVIQLIRINQLPASYADRLDPYVQAKYAELWGYARIVDEDH